MKFNGFEIEKYNQYDLNKDSKYSVCPLCSKDRKKDKEKCLMLDWSRGLGTCQHCGEVIQLHTYKARKTEKQYVKPEWKNNTELSDKIVQFFEDRKISQQVLKNMKISSGSEHMPQFNKKVDTIQFNYFVHDELINIKFRGPKKTFKLNKGSELIFYNINSIQNETECYIVEGEIDCLSLIQCGIHNVVSVPNGATTRNVNLEYLDNCIEYFENKEKIYLCLDNDDAGHNLENELLRRLGPERCFKFNFNGCKDANEYHVKYGGESLREVLNNPEPFPITDIITMKDDGDALDDYLINGMPRGYNIGIDKFDDIFTVETGRYLVITGIPTYGKTTILDHFITRWNIMHNWKTAICSPENMPAFFHKERIITKILGYKPDSKQHVNSDAYKQVKEYIDDNFFFMSFNDGRFELKKTLEKARELVIRKGIKVLIIDPYNKVRLKESIGKGWNEYTTDYLSELDVFARANDILIVLVAHPNKMNKDGAGQREMPDFYDVKGGGEFYDMSPFGLTVHRDKERNEIIIKVLKVKFAHLGQNGEQRNFKYNINNGRITELDSMGEPKWDNSNWLNSEPKQTELDSNFNFDDVEDIAAF
jgi:twinkle protein